MSKKTNKSKNWLLYILFFGFIIEFIKRFFVSKKSREIVDNLKEFAKEEEQEIIKLAKGKENFNRFCCDSGSIFKDYFIPHSGNDHKPKLLHTHSLAVIGVSVLMLKILVTGYLFFIYPNEAYMSEAMVAQIFELTNRSRTENKIPALNDNNVLNLAASAKAMDMIEHDYFAHYGPDGKKPWEWINRDKYAYLYVGENLAMNFSSANSAHTALMNSESHKHNILNSRYSDLGLAIVSGELNGKETSVLVEMFGTRQSAYLAATDVKSETPAQNTNQAKESEILPKTSVTQTEEVEETNIAVKPIVSESAKPIMEEMIKPESQNLAMREENVISEPQAIPLETATKINTEKLIAREETVKDASLVLGTESDELVSPNEEIENNSLSVVTFHPNTLKKQSLALQVVSASNYVLISILAVLVVALLLNILIRVSIQHKSVIIQTMVLILFIVGLVNIKIHFIEKVAEMVAII